MTTARACLDCGTDVDVAAYGLCDPCDEKRTVAERAAQGLPAEIEDPAVRLRAAEILGLVDPLEHKEAPNAA